MIAPETMAVEDESGKILVGETVLIFKVIAKIGLRPIARRVAAAIIEPRAVGVEFIGEVAIDKQNQAGARSHQIGVQANVMIFEAGKGVLPLGRRVDGDFEAAEEIVLAGKLVAVRRNGGMSFKIPCALHLAPRIGVAQAQPQANFVAQLSAEIGAL